MSIIVSHFWKIPYFFQVHYHLITICIIVPIFWKYFFYYHLIKNLHYCSHCWKIFFFYYHLITNFHYCSHFWKILWYFLQYITMYFQFSPFSLAYFEILTCYNHSYLNMLNIIADNIHHVLELQMIDWTFCSWGDGVCDMQESTEIAVSVLEEEWIMPCSISNIQHENRVHCG